MLPGVERLRGSISAALSKCGVRGSSFEYTTFSLAMPRFFSSRRITRASGQTDVLYMSATSKPTALSLLPAPMQLIILVPARLASSIIKSFDDIVSIASIT